MIRGAPDARRSPRDEPPADAVAPPARVARSHALAIFLISAAGILLEIGYTRLISFKLFYYYTYVIIGFAMLGIGAGAVAVAVIPQLRKAPANRALAVSCCAAAATVVAGYLGVARSQTNSFSIWQDGTELLKLIALCGALFASFALIGLVIAVILTRNPERCGRLYCADLKGAGLACAIVVPLIGALAVPACIWLGGAVLALTAARLALGEHRGLLVTSLALAGAIVLGIAVPGAIPDVLPDSSKSLAGARPESKLYSRWGPVFRVDVTPSLQDKDVCWIHHDGILGSTLHRFDGDEAALTRFDEDPRPHPFRIPERPPRDVLIIGAAGGHEMLASLYFGAEKIQAVELNPIAVSLVEEVFADYTGRLHEDPRVRLVVDERRSFLSREPESRYDLILFVPPDTYAAVNSASSGAFVLSESYLYTKEMIIGSLEHLRTGGMISMMFGEFSYTHKPVRTACYVGTARAAMKEMGIEDFGRHVLVATQAGHMKVGKGGGITLSSILLKREPFRASEIERFLENLENVPGSQLRHAWGHRFAPSPVNNVISLPMDQLSRWYDRYLFNITPVSDDSSFFWHFAKLRPLLQSIHKTPLPSVDPEYSTGERLMITTLIIAAGFAFVFLLAPFVAIRRRRLRFPRKLSTTIFFAAVGLGFMFFEICLIQKLTLFPGYPTYSLTVTLMAVLVSTGLGSLVGARYLEDRDRVLPVLLGSILALMLFYEFGMNAVTHALLGSPPALRMAMTFLFTMPLGFVLGGFMPMGLVTVSRLAPHGSTYASWGWAVNGFFSVIGSILTTLMAMSLGSSSVLWIGLAAYVVASVTLRSIPLRPAEGSPAV